MCGNDPAGKAFALSYRQGGQGVFVAAEAAVNACHNVGYGIEVSASNYAHSEAASTIGGGEPSVQPPGQPSKFSGPKMPNPFGPAVGEPLLWAVVAEFVGSPWPDGNPETLRDAAGAWRTFGAAVTGVKGAISGCSAELSGHDIPELAGIINAVTQLSSGVGGLGKQCESIASSLDSFAGEVEASQQAIRDLLHRLSLSGILEELGSIFSGHNPLDDIKKIADDIKQILHTLSREADGSSALFKAAMGELDTLTTDFENWTRKEFTHFLGDRVGNAVADFYNSDVDIVEGLGKSVFETVGSLGDLATHPQQLLDLLKQANPEYQIARWVADPKGTFEHNLDAVKGLVDAKDWTSDHPMRGLGDNVGTGLQFLIPGAGEAKAGAEGARAADEAAQAAKADGKAAEGLLGGGLKSDVVGQSSRIAHDLDGIKATPAEPGAVKPVDPGAVKPADPAPGRPSDLSGAAKSGEPGSPVKPAEPGAAKPAEPGIHEPALAGSAAAPAEYAPAGAPHDLSGSPAEHGAGAPHSVPTEGGPHGADGVGPASGGDPSGGARRDHDGGHLHSEDHDHHPGEGDPLSPDGSGDEIPEPLYRDEPLDTGELLDQYKGEDDPTNPGRFFAPKTVHYMTPSELEESRLFARNGLLYGVSDGMPFDTRNAATHWSGDGRAMFVMDEHGNIYASLEQDVGRLHHSSFLGGAPVAGAGEIEVIDGVATLITRKSGHYLPTEEQLSQVRDMLSEQGIDIGGIIFESGF